MFLDIIVILILVLSMVFGFRRGFIYTFTHTLGWLGAMVAAFLFSSRLREFLTEETGLYDSLHAVFSDKLSLSSESLDSSSGSLPLMIGRGFNTAAEQASALLADKLANLTMTILCFLIIFIVVKLLVSLLTRLFSRRKTKGFVGFVDGLLGLVAGLIKGVILVFVFFALLLPVVNLVSPESTQLILDSLAASKFSRILYDSNFVVLIINDFLL